MLAVTGEDVFEPQVEMSLDTIGRQFGEQGRVQNHIEGTRCVWEDGSDFMSGIEDLHPLSGEQK